jgi:23S rRNA pseudouridine1911/1915/1917 synthase
MQQRLLVSEGSAGQRLDVFCTSALSGYSRSAIQRSIKDGSVLVNGKPAKARQVMKVGDVVHVSIKVAPVIVPAVQVDLNIPIVHEDRDVVVINKPAGIAAHAGVGIQSGTVANWFAKRYPNAINVGEVEGRSGIVHRLDKDTSGVMILAKNENAYIHLKKQFQLRRPKKEYLALVFGVPGGRDGRITRSIGRSRRNPMRRAVDDAGKDAATDWIVEEKYASGYSLIRAFPKTGRMHQIRVHLHFLGYPIVGDQLYTFKRKKQPQGVTRHLLHAEKLTITLPNGDTKTFTAPLPEDFAGVLAGLSSQSS